mgnify:FL=1|jgi:hypothetical protein
MEIGGRNIQFGLVILTLAGLFSFYLGFTIPAHLSDGIYEMNLGRVTLRAGHTHGMLIGLCNVVVGILLSVQPFSSKSKQIASWLCVSAVLLPIGLILRGLTNGAMTFAPVAVLGGCGLLGTFITLLVGYRKAA